jgi:hypothetical protein
MAADCKKTYREITGRYAVKISYQAVHKAMEELVAKKVLVKQNNQYSINIEWIRQVNEFGKRLELNYLGTKVPLVSGIEDIKYHGDLTTITFVNIQNVDKFLIEMEKKYVTQQGTEKKIICWHTPHFWWGLLYPASIYSDKEGTPKLVKEGKVEVYILLTSKTPIDKRLANFYREMGYKVKIVNVASNYNYIVGVFGDTVVETYWPLELKNMVDKIYSTKTDLTDLPRFVKDILEKKTRIHVVINRNKAIAEEIRKYTLAYFKKEYRISNFFVCYRKWKFGY